MKFLAFAYVVVFVAIAIYDSIKYNKDKSTLNIIATYLSDIVLLAFAYAFWLGSFSPLFDKCVVGLCVVVFVIEFWGYIQTAGITLKEDPNSTFTKELIYSVSGNVLFYIPVFYWMIAYTVRIW